MVVHHLTHTYTLGSLSHSLLLASEIPRAERYRPALGPRGLIHPRADVHAHRGHAAPAGLVAHALRPVLGKRRTLLICIQKQ